MESEFAFRDSNWSQLNYLIIHPIYFLFNNLWSFLLIIIFLLQSLSLALEIIFIINIILIFQFIFIYLFRYLVIYLHFHLFTLFYLVSYLFTFLCTIYSINIIIIIECMEIIIYTPFVVNGETFIQSQKYTVAYFTKNPFL